MTSTQDIAWAAGFLEGEGCWPKARQLAVVIGQVQRWPLERMVSLFGGRIGPPVVRSAKNPAHRDCYVWTLHGPDAAQLCMTVYALMSPVRKEQIRRALAQWSVKKFRDGFLPTCSRGHEYQSAPPNNERAKRYCPECQKATARARYARLTPVACASCGKPKRSRKSPVCLSCAARVAQRRRRDTERQRRSAA